MVGGGGGGLCAPLQDFALKMQGGGAYARGGAHLRDTAVLLYVHSVVFTI